MAVQIEIEINRCDAPTLVINTGGFGDVGERAVAVVSVEDVLSEVCDVKFSVAIVIDIACCCGHAVSGVAGARDVSDIGKPSISIVAIEGVSCTAGRRAFIGQVDNDVRRFGVSCTVGRRAL